MEEGRSPVLLTERKNHLEYLHQQLKTLSGISSFCMADGWRKNDSRFRNNSPLSHQKKSACCWRPGGTSEKDLTMPAWILYSSRYQFRGKVHSCNMPGDCTGCILTKTKFGSSITWMAIYPCWPGCSKKDFVDIMLWGTKKVMPGVSVASRGRCKPQNLF